MKSMHYDGGMEVVVVSVEPGEKLLEAIEQAIAAHDIRNGVVISGIATLKRCEMHYIEHTDFPPDDTFYSVEHPLEVGSVSGIIADGQPHLHIVSGWKDRKTWVGHLERGSIVGYLAEICVLKFNDLAMVRRRDEQRKINLLGPR